MHLLMKNQTSGRDNQNKLVHRPRMEWVFPWQHWKTPNPRYWRWLSAVVAAPQSAAGCSCNQRTCWGFFLLPTAEASCCMIDEAAGSPKPSKTLQVIKFQTTKCFGDPYTYRRSDNVNTNTVKRRKPSIAAWLAPTWARINLRSKGVQSYFSLADFCSFSVHSIEKQATHIRQPSGFLARRCGWLFYAVESKGYMHRDTFLCMLLRSKMWAGDKQRLETGFQSGSKACLSGYGECLPTRTGL